MGNIDLRSDREPSATASTVATATLGRGSRRAADSRLAVNAIRVAVVAVVLALWQVVPQVPAIQQHVTVLNAYFLSSPARVFHVIVELATGSETTGAIWSYLTATLVASLAGTVAGTVTGMLLALWLSTSDLACRVLNPFIAVVNATPRVAIVPVIVIIVGPTPLASAITAVTIVFFIIFFNAFEGSRAIPDQTLANAMLLGAGRASSMWRVRFPYAAAWAFAALPNAISFGLVGAVTAEILSGAHGVGLLMTTATNTTNADLTFGVVAYVGALGVVLVLLTGYARRRLLHWWDVDPL